MPLKTIVLLAYYNRPLMVVNALDSIRENAKTHKDWVLAVLDDGSPHPAKPVVERELPEFQDQIFYVINDETPEQKAARGGHAGSELINRAITHCKADIAIVLCDDDALCPNYLRDLSRWYENNPGEFSSWCYVVTFDPIVERPMPWMAERPESRKNYLNAQQGAIAPACKVDASQVSWKTSANFDYGVWWPSRAWRNHDSLFFEKLTEKTGMTPCNGLTGQYKGFHSNQLSWRPNEVEWSDPIDILDVKEKK